MVCELESSNNAKANYFYSNKIIIIIYDILYDMVIVFRKDIKPYINILFKRENKWLYVRIGMSWFDTSTIPVQRFDVIHLICSN